MISSGSKKTISQMNPETRRVLKSSANTTVAVAPRLALSVRFRSHPKFRISSASIVEDSSDWVYY
jgi:hypothetical protein